MIASSWTSHFTAICERLGIGDYALIWMPEFFAGDDDLFRMQPQLQSLTVDGFTHHYQRRAACCRYYLLPEGDLCASCRLVSDEERFLETENC